ncbi:SpoIIIAH-like family protein [Inediibacterium massiliense]|uniref:SpoIIIAH-like family protein n=1 Tax=Inediibacterium massiliense TaxID=1658111 RepID=UPI0006B65E6E|nr:SpoIIIAH-like family protein [Inediibacterium massiliense]
MFKIRGRNVLVLSLAFTLCLIGYLNYAINKYTALETSTDFQKYEEEQLKQNSKKENNPVESTDPSETAKAEKNVVDSSNQEINDIIQKTSKNIKESIHSQKVSKTNYFIESRLNMNLEREKMVSLLNEIINNDKTDEENRKAATNEKMKLIDIMNKEKVIENLIQSKGFEDALVFITENSVNVIVGIEQLADSDVAKILDIVMRETKYSPEHIKILNKF